MNKAEIFLKKHSSVILSSLGATGVIATTVLAVKATPKALSLVEEARTEKGEDLTTIEIIQAAWKPYVPSALIGLSTIACIFGASYLSTRGQASLMSAYALLDRTYKEYQNKVNEIYGNDANMNVRHEIVKSSFDDDMELHDNMLLFYDHQSRHFFESTMEDVVRAENEFLEVFHKRGYACVNEYYDFLGIPHVEYGFQLGWFDIENNDPYNCKELTIEYEEVPIRGDKKCWIITTSMPPSFDYII